MIVIHPRDELKPYVRYYWILESDEPFSILTFPIGCPQIILHKKTPLYIPEINATQSIITISGQVNFPAHIQSGGDLEMIVAVFYPHTVGMFIDTPPSAFYNIEISGYDIANRQLQNIAQKIFDCKNHKHCIDILENWLLSGLNPSANIKRIEKTLVALYLEPDKPISSLADISCLSKRQFERIFLETVGMNPKEYSRIVRFQKAIWMMQNGEQNYAGIAAGCGFSDQSHFIREFKNMSGYTPHTIRQYVCPYSDLFTTPV